MAIHIMAERAERLPIRGNDLPDVTDAGVGLTLLMISALLADRERQALHLQLAAAVELQDWTAVAALHRRMAAIAPSVARMADAARAGIGRGDAGLIDPAGHDPAVTARTRRSLIRAANWLERGFWPLYGTIWPAMPPALDATAPRDAGGDTAPATAPATATARTTLRGVKSCRKATKQRLRMLDGELARLAADPRAAGLTARLMIVDDRNGHAARCRACARCRLSGAHITEPLPTP